VITSFAATWKQGLRLLKKWEAS